MDWGSQLGDLNWWAVVGATASTFVVGSAWYSMSVFGKKWAKLIGLSEKDMKSGDGMTEVFVMTGITSFITAAVMGALMMATGTSGAADGLLFGAIAGVAFRFGSHVMHNGFARRSKDLTWIDGMHDIVALAVVGAVLGQWL